MGNGWSVVNDAIRQVAAATRGDVSEPLKDIATRAKDAELSDDNAFSEYLADLVPPALKQFDQAAERALSAAADFADALADGLEATQKSYEDADDAASGDLVKLTEGL